MAYQDEPSQKKKRLKRYSNAMAIEEHFCKRSSKHVNDHKYNFTAQYATLICLVPMEK